MQAGQTHEQISAECFAWTNKVRANPQSVIPDLQERLKHFNGNVYTGGGFNLRTNEGPKVINELIAQLQSQKALPLLTREPGLDSACLDHCVDIGPRGLCSHDGSNGSTMTSRINKYGKWSSGAGECISFGQKTGKDVVI
jgi:uncharacterized protein YkwD